MQHRQRGMTMLGILVLVVVVGAWVYAGIRMAPKYLEYMRVASTLEQVRDGLALEQAPGDTGCPAHALADDRHDGLAGRLVERGESVLELVAELMVDRAPRTGSVGVTDRKADRVLGRRL